jgi:hypothetical protein
MKIRLEKKQGEKVLILFASEDKAEGIYLSQEDVLKLKANLDEMLEYKLESVGDSI